MSDLEEPPKVESQLFLIGVFAFIVSFVLPDPFNIVLFFVFAFCGCYLGVASFVRLGKYYYNVLKKRRKRENV